MRASYEKLLPLLEDMKGVVVARPKAGSNMLVVRGNKHGAILTTARSTNTEIPKNTEYTLVIGEADTMLVFSRPPGDNTLPVQVTGFEELSRVEAQIAEILDDRLSGQGQRLDQMLKTLAAPSNSRTDIYDAGNIVQVDSKSKSARPLEKYLNRLDSDVFRLQIPAMEGKRMESLSTIDIARLQAAGMSKSDRKVLMWRYSFKQEQRVVAQRVFDRLEAYFEALPDRKPEYLRTMTFNIAGRDLRLNFFPKKRNNHAELTIKDVENQSVHAGAILGVVDEGQDTRVIDFSRSGGFIFDEGHSGQDTALSESRLRARQFAAKVEPLVSYRSKWLEDFFKSEKDLYQMYAIEQLVDEAISRQ
jgi:hypothetical protein